METTATKVEGGKIILQHHDFVLAKTPDFYINLFSPSKFIRCNSKYIRSLVVGLEMFAADGELVSRFVVLCRFSENLVGYVLTGAFIRKDAIGGI